MENGKTLRAVIRHPLRKAQPFSVLASALAVRLKEEDKGSDPASPDTQALRFYGLNQLVGLLSQKYTENQPLPSWGQKAVAMYCEELVSQHRRMFWYTFLVTSREWRHLKNLATVASKCPGLYPADMQALNKLIKDDNSDSTLDSWLTKVPNIGLDKYCETLVHSFNNGSWSSGYGGKPWGKIAQTLHRYVTGETSAEVFIDTAYTLAHNNGPMFNKGMMYQHYSDSFKVILDIQRSGQVCEALIEGRYSTALDVTVLARNAKDEFGLLDYVDWYKVEALGALGHYGALKAQQDKVHGKKPEVTLVNGKPVKVTGQFEWFPNKSVPIFERI